MTLETPLPRLAHINVLLCLAYDQGAALGISGTTLLGRRLPTSSISLDSHRELGAL